MTRDGDQVDQAIRALSAAPPARPMAQVPVQLQTGQVVVLVTPLDITEREVMELTSWMLSTLQGHLAANAAASPLIVARGKLPT